MCVSDSGIISLKGMSFEGVRIGCLDAEQRQGNHIVVDFSCTLDLREACASDRLEDTLDYGAIYGLVAESLSEPCRLLEYAAGRIVRAVEAAYPCLKEFTVTVSKENPPADGPVKWSSVTLSCVR